ncbi:hypothetical protein [Nonomuraea typhae]|uniref:hypothetical protein n=1 Tax=Nonomuraea typhae TaxID=2603600 RepID=UPI0012FAB3FD|nr:hypothetical protein [Nonomuraea typhae]
MTAAPLLRRFALALTAAAAIATLGACSSGGDAGADVKAACTEINTAIAGATETMLKIQSDPESVDAEEAKKAYSTAAAGLTAAAAKLPDGELKEAALSVAGDYEKAANSEQTGPNEKTEVIKRTCT